MMAFCDEQRQRHAELWARVTNHRLIDQLVNNSIPKPVLARYLAQDHLVDWEAISSWQAKKIPNNNRSSQHFSNLKNVL